MNRQRGVISGYVYLAGGIAILGLLSGMAYMAKSYLDGVTSEAHDAGRKEALLEVGTRDNSQLAAVQKRILELQAELLAAESRHQVAVSRIDQEGTDVLRTLEKERDAARRAARDYAGRLRDHGRAQAVACPAVGGGDAAAAPRAGAGVDPGSAGAQAPGSELSDAAGVFLRAEADRADEVVHERNALAVRLEACQGLVIADRRP